MKLNVKQPILDLKGNTVKDPDGAVFSVGMALGNILVEAKEGGKMKMYILAVDCYKEKDVDLDPADLALVKKAVENTVSYSNLVTGQILLTLEEDGKSK